MNKSNFPIATLCITLFCLALHLLYIYDYSSSLQLGPLLSPMIMDRNQIWDGQYWGLLTGSFVHIHSIQLVLYLMAFWYLGSLVELSLGRQALLACVYFGAIFPNAAQMALSESPDLMATGMSGVVYMLFGLLLTMRPTVPVYRRMIGNGMIRWAIFWMLASLLLASLTRMVPMVEWIYYVSELVLIIYMIAVFVAVLRVGMGNQSMRRLLVQLIPVDPKLRFAVLVIFNIALLANAMYWPIAHIAQLVGIVMGIAAGNVFLLHRNRLLYGVILAMFVMLTLCSVRWLPWSDNWTLHRIYELTETQQDDQALELLETLAERRPGSPTVLNGLAWLLATSEDPQFADGEKAIKLAIQANAAAQWQEPHMIDTLAAAYAQAGQWDRALETQQLALDKMESTQYQDPRYRELQHALEQNYEKLKKGEKIRR